MDRGTQTWGSTAVLHNGAYAPTAAFIPRGPAGIPDEAYGGPALNNDEAYGTAAPLKGFRGRIPRTSA